MHKKFIMSLIILFLAFSLCGCVKVTPVTVTTTDISTTTTPVTKTVVSVSTSELWTTTTATIYITNSTGSPELVNQTYTLEYGNNSILMPIYLGEGQVLHLHWNVIDGESFRMIFRSPNGIEWGLYPDGLNSMPATLPLTESGSIVLSPAWFYDPVENEKVEVDFSEGYYMFNPYNDSGVVVVEFLYWIEC